MDWSWARFLVIIATKNVSRSALLLLWQFEKFCHLQRPVPLFWLYLCLSFTHFFFALCDCLRNLDENCWNGYTKGSLEWKSGVGAKKISDLQVLNYVWATKYVHPTPTSQWRAVKHLSPLAAIFIQCPVRQAQSGNYNHTFPARAQFLTAAAFIYPCLEHCSLNGSLLQLPRSLWKGLTGSHQTGAHG